MASSKKPPVDAQKPASATPMLVAPAPTKAAAPAATPAVKPAEAKPVEAKAAPAAVAAASVPAPVAPPKATPVAEAPKVAPAPVVSAPIAVKPAEPAPKPAPKVEAPKVEAPKAEVPKTTVAKPVAKTEVPKVEAPKAVVPKVEAPKAAPAKPVAPKAEKPAAAAATVIASLDMLKPVTLVQENMRASTEKAISAFKGQYAEVKTIAETATTRLEDSVKAAQEGSRVLGFKLFEIVKAQTEAHLEHAKTIATAKSLPELLTVQQSFFVAQIEMAQTRGKDVATLAGKVANDVTAPLRASLDMLLRR